MCNLFPQKTNFMKHLYYFIVVMLCFNFTIAQITITGNVVDDQGVPLPGATILEVGTSTVSYTHLTLPTT